MATENKELMHQAREALTGKWGLAAITTLVYLLIVGTAPFTIMVQIYPHVNGNIGIVSLILGGPMALGYALFSLSIARKQEARLEQLFDGFKRFLVSFTAYLLISVFTFLWLLLLIVPGIIAAISYSQTFYIIAEDPDIHAMEAIDKSKKMMYGYKWKYFYLILRFIGWALLCILTLGIGFLWLAPYMQVTMANFYDDIKGQPVEHV